VADAADLFALQKYGTIYTRISNPTTAAFEERMASLDGGIGAVATASGQAAEFLTAVALAEQGCNLVSSSALYGGTHTMFETTLGRFGIEARFVDGDDPDAFAARIDADTRFLYTEVIGNPSGAVADLAALADVAHAHDLPLVVDSTFGRVDRIMAVHSLNPAGLAAHDGLYRSAMSGTGTLRKVERELVALVVSLENQCHY